MFSKTIYLKERAGFVEVILYVAFVMVNGCPHLQEPPEGF